MSEDLRLVSLLCKDSVLSGDILFVPSHLKIGGKVHQHIECQGKLVIGRSGIVRGNIKTEELVLEGVFQGEVWASGTVSISSSATVIGYISAEKLKIEEGAYCQFDACVDTGAGKRLKQARLNLVSESVLNSIEKYNNDLLSSDQSDEEPSPSKDYTPEDDTRDSKHSTTKTDESYFPDEEEEKKMIDRFW